MSNFFVKYNSGVDNYCISTRATSILKIKRNLQISIIQKGFSGWFTKVEVGSLFHKKTHIKALIKNRWLIKKSQNGKEYFKFKSETYWLKEKINNDFKERRLSISQKVWIFAISSEYSVSEEIKFDVDFSWAILINSLLPLMSQQKIANLTKYSREAVNSKLKKNKLIEVINQHLKISDDVFSKFKTKKHLKAYLAANNLKGYKVSFDGKLYRQLPNKYKIKFKVNYFNKTFEYQSRKLNKTIKTSSKIPNAGPLWVKKISLNRSAKRSSKLSLKGLSRKRGSLILTSETMVNGMIGRNGCIKSLPSKLKKEVNRIGTKMNLCSSFSKNKNLKYGMIKVGDFHEVNNFEFNKFRFDILKLQKIDTKTKQYHSMRKTQRLSMDFNGAAVIMCKAS